MDIVALIISICAAAFAGVVACIAFREQRLRLRPYVYIGKANAAITDKALVINIGITNCGLLPAKITTISSELKFDGDLYSPPPWVNPKHEIRNKFEIRILECSKLCVFRERQNTLPLYKSGNLRV